MSEPSDTNAKDGAEASSRPRPSLRELAERAKQTERARRVADTPSVPAVAAAPVSVPPSRPGGDPLFGMGATNRPPAPAAAPARSSYGIAIGASLALLGIAAAGVLVVRGRHAGYSATQRADASRPSQVAAPPETAQAAPAPAAAADDAKAAGAAKTDTPPEPADEAPAAAQAAPRGPAALPQGAAGARPAPNGSLPDQPEQASVQAAVRTVMAQAKGCVAGADDASRAQVTFSSAGIVTGVSVSGWAAGKPAAACLKNALKGVRVDRFAKPTFTVGVVVRP